MRYDNRSDRLLFWSGCQLLPWESLKLVVFQISFPLSFHIWDIGFTPFWCLINFFCVVISDKCRPFCCHLKDPFSSFVNVYSVTVSSHVLHVSWSFSLKKSSLSRPVGVLVLLDTCGHVLQTLERWTMYILWSLAYIFLYPTPFTKLIN